MRLYFRFSDPRDPAGGDSVVPIRCSDDVTIGDVLLLWAAKYDKVAKEFAADPVLSAFDIGVTGPTGRLMKLSRTVSEFDEVV